MLISFKSALNTARIHGFALGAFNVYNLEGVTAVIRSAETAKSPVILQILPSALALGGPPLIRLCRAAAETATVPAAVHLDHCSRPDQIRIALKAGVSSVMADGASLPFEENIRFTAQMADLARACDAGVEGELGFLGGSEDGQTAPGDLERLTRPDQAARFVNQTGITALAVCIGNRHGRYPGTPQLDFHRLEEIRNRVDIPLVLHGTSGLPDEMIQKAVDLGVCKFNVNTEVRRACLNCIREEAAGKGESLELVHLMEASIRAMEAPILSKLLLFRSAGKADLYKSDEPPILKIKEKTCQNTP